VVEDDRVLCSGQTDSAENGPWVVETSTWTRPVDFDDEEEILSGAVIVVDNPSGSSGFYRMTYVGTLTLGTTDITVTATDISVLDEDDFSSDSAVAPPSQQSAGAYIATEIASELSSFLLDEDTQSSNSATKAASQQSLVAYIATQIAASVYTPTKPTVTVHTTSTTHSFQANVIWAQIIVQGGGGGGGGSNGSGSATGGGGAGGGYSMGIADVDALGTKEATIVVGSGGAGGTTSTFGSDGTSSSYDDGTLTMTCNGGDGGSDNDDSTTVIVGGSASGGSLNMTGWYNTAQTSTAGNPQIIGGSSMLGSGSLSSNTLVSTPHRDGHGYGSGGSAGTGNNTAAIEAGGDGGDGVVIIMEYL